VLSDPYFFIVLAAVLAVAVILLIGIGGFAKGGDFNKKHANRVMRWRLYMQAVAVALIVAFVIFRQARG
jgi:hypothetical protein